MRERRLQSLMADRLVLRCTSCQTKFAISFAEIKGRKQLNFHCSQCDSYFSFEEGRVIEKDPEILKELTLKRPKSISEYFGEVKIREKPIQEVERIEKSEEPSEVEHAVPSSNRLFYKISFSKLAVLLLLVFLVYSYYNRDSIRSSSITVSSEITSAGSTIAHNELYYFINHGLRLPFTPLEDMPVAKSSYLYTKTIFEHRFRDLLVGLFQGHLPSGEQLLIIKLSSGNLNSYSISALMLDNHPRLVVDIKEFSLPAGGTYYLEQNPLAESIRFGAYQSKVRIVIDLADKVVIHRPVSLSENSAEIQLKLTN